MNKNDTVTRRGAAVNLEPLDPDTTDPHEPREEVDSSLSEAAEETLKKLEQDRS
jgi:hypothetical protein